MSMVYCLISHQQIAPPHIRVVRPAQHLEAAVGEYPAEVVGGDEAAGIEVGEVNEVEDAGLAGLLRGKWVSDFTSESPQRWGGAEQPVAGGVGLREQFRHAVLGVDGGGVEGGFERIVEFRAGEFPATAFHATRFHDGNVLQIKGLAFGEVEEGEGDAQKEDLRI